MVSNFLNRLKNMIIQILIISVFFVQSCSQINNKIDKIMDRQYYISTSSGIQNCNYLIEEKGFKYIDENRLISPKPMVFDYKELQWLKENLSSFVSKSYPQLSKETLEQIKTISIEEIKSRPYIFTNFFHDFSEDVYLLKIKNTDYKIYNIYLIKYLDDEAIKDEKGEFLDNVLVKKIRFENEEWYRDFFSNEEEYNKNKYSENSTNTVNKKKSNRKYSTLLENEEKEIYKTFEGKSYTYDEWKIFEDEYYKIYKEKRNKKGFWDSIFG